MTKLKRLYLIAFQYLVVSFFEVADFDIVCIYYEKACAVSPEI